MKTKYLIILALLFSATAGFAQNESIFIQNEVTITVKKVKSHFVGGGIGAGIPYGNLGGRVVAKLASWADGSRGFGLSAGVGSRFVPLSLVTPLESSKGDDETMYSPYTMWAKMGIPYNLKTVHGLSYSVGIMLFISNMSVGFNFAQLGEYLSVTGNVNKPVYGYNVTCEGFIPLGKVPLAINVGGEFGLNFVNYQTINLKKELSLGVNCGLHLGLVYLFRY